MSKRMPEDDAPEPAPCALRQHRERLGTVRRVEDQPVLGRELTRGLARARRMAVAAAEPVNDEHRER